MKPYKRFQEQPYHIRAYLWWKYYPFAFFRGIYWYFKQDHTEKLSNCIGWSFGDIQAEKMHWVYTMQETQEYLDKKKSSQKKR